MKKYTIINNNQIGNSKHETQTITDENEYNIK